MESGNTWQISRTHTPLLCGRHKCMFPFYFFKVWSVTCLNAYEILNFMEIQSSYLLLSYQRNKAYISHYISYFLNNFLVSLCQYINHHICLLFVTKFCFWNVIDGNGKLTQKLKYKGGIYKRNHNFCFRIFVFTILIHT